MNILGLRLLVIGSLVLVASLIYLNKLDIVFPETKIKFVDDSSINSPVEFSYCYEGKDIIRDIKFGGYGCSKIIETNIGTDVLIPKRRILSYWPGSQFSHLLINGQSGKKDCNAVIVIENLRDQLESIEIPCRLPSNY